MTTPRDIPFGRPWITDKDRAAVMEVLNGHVLTHGPNCTGFENEFAEVMGGGYAASTSSCMAALHLCYLHLGVGPSDEVIVPAQTHVATVHAVELTGATPVFVDCDLATGNMNINKLEEAITDKTKAIGIVHFVGIPMAMPDVMAIADKHGLKVIEDCALAVGARYDGRHVGLFGEAGCYSFYPVKHITSGEGGMFVSQHEDVVKKVANFRAFSYDRSLSERTIPEIYDVTNVGMNYRMSELQGALGRSQINKIPEILSKRSANFTALEAALSNIDDLMVLDSTEPKSHNSHYCLVAVLTGKAAEIRNNVVLELKERKIGCSIYYPHPVPRLMYYKNKYGYDAKAFPNAAAISDQGIALPVGPHLNEDDMAYIGKVFANVKTSLTKS
jgi:dTDP-4-amino-4,6-dideoxygalactose transaminase